MTTDFSKNQIGTEEEFLASALEAGVGPEAAKKHYAVLSTIKNLDDERRALLVDDMLSRAKGALRQGLAEAGNDLPTLLAMCEVAVNILNLAGFANATTANGHEDWTRTGDKQVDRIWGLFSESIQTASAEHVIALAEEDLPADVAERFRNGTQTEEDLQKVQDLICEKTGVPKEAVADARVHHVEVDEQAAKATETSPSYGMYL